MPILQTEQFIVLWILFIIIVFGNAAVLFVMFLNRHRKSRMNYFIKQLAIAGVNLSTNLQSLTVDFQFMFYLYFFLDLGVGILNVITDIIWRMTIAWLAGNFACKVIRFLQVIVTYASTYLLVAMSIDRYDAITNPMNFSRSCKY